jgi:hypothetical protein
MNSFFANKKYKVVPIMELIESGESIPLVYDISPNKNLLFSAIVFFYKHAPENKNHEVDLDKLERGEYNV